MDKLYNKTTDDYMFRYLEKYVGTYRVLAAIDESSGEFPDDSSFEDFYIPCNRNCVIKHTYEGNDILALCFYDSASTAKNVAKELKEQKIEFELDTDNNCVDSYILFNAKDIKKVAKIVKPKTSGRTIHPLSKRNLVKGKNSNNYKIPTEDLEKLNKSTMNLTKTEKLQAFRKINSDFIDSLSKKDKKDYKALMKMDGLNARQFIHMNGYWDKYIKYVNKNLKSI